MCAQHRGILFHFITLSFLLILGIALALDGRITHADEKSLVKLIYHYSTILQEASDNLSPALMANYTYELAKSFNHFY